MERAGDTLGRLPSYAARTRLTKWPGYVRDWWHAYNSSEAPEVRPGAPAPEAIDQLDEVVQWCYWLHDSADQRIVMGRMFDVSWRKLQSMDGRSEPTLRKRYRHSLHFIAERLNRERKKVF